MKLWKAAPLVLVAFSLTGCLSIKSQGASQRAPGVVTLGGVVCGSDYNQSSYSGCDDSNVAETDNRAHQGCDADHGAGDPVSCGLEGDGQLLVGFRVPLGFDAPEAFTTDARDLHFETSASYTQQLQKHFPAPSDEHWVGYISDVRTFATGKAAEEPTGIHAEFSLPQRDGQPFAGPFRWRWVVGFRNVTKAQAGDPVECDGLSAGICFDAPAQERIPTELPPENVSDFAVASPAAATVPQTRTATLSFPVRFTDARNLGAQDLTLSASTTVPGTAARAGTASVHAAPNTTTVVDVSVPVPLGTPPGPYTVTLTAQTGSPAVSRQGTATLVVAPPPDGDGDGISDPSDRCPATARGAFDADRDGCVGPYARITAIPTGTWTVSDAGVRIGSMRIPALPTGARVTVVCKACHVKQTLTSARSTVNLPKLSNKLLRRGESFTATITRTGFIGEQVTLTVKRYGHSRAALVQEAKRPFTKRQACVPVGSATPAKRCSPTPATGP
jgi:hypothetical protein